MTVSAAADPLFRSAHQALLFAHTFADTSHAQAAAAERAIALQARDRYERPVGAAGRGLRGIDGAAQAGMIQDLVSRNTPPVGQLAITARFRILRSADRKAACAALALYARKTDAVSAAVRDREAALQLLLRRHFGMKVDVGRLADREGVNRTTIWRWQADIKKWVAKIEYSALSRAEDALREAGVIE